MPDEEQAKAAVDGIPLFDTVLLGRRTYEIATMKSQPGKDLIIFGSGSIVSQLTRQGLIDEYQFVVCPIFLGSGRPLSNLLKRLETGSFGSETLRSGDVLLRYAPQN